MSRWREGQLDEPRRPGEDLVPLECGDIVHFALMQLPPVAAVFLTEGAIPVWHEGRVLDVDDEAESVQVKLDGRMHGTFWVPYADVKAGLMPRPENSL